MKNLEKVRQCRTNFLRNRAYDEKPSVQHMVFGTKLIERETT
ncbi:MAG: hypothetical protein ACLUUG_12325 [Lachnospiraceae bacterium]